jgi:hypothetical protein
MKNGAAVRFDDKPAKATMRIVQHPRAPMMAGSERDLERSQLHLLPLGQFVHNVKTEIVHKIANTGRHDDRLIGSDATQRPAVEMIEVRVGHEDGVDRGQVIDLQAGTLEPFDHAEPHRPIRINQHVHPLELNQERACPIQVIQISLGRTLKSGLARWLERLVKSEESEPQSESCACANPIPA